MHILLVRHGQSCNNVIAAKVGDGSEFHNARDSNPALSTLGQKQADLLGKHLGAQLRGSSKNVRIWVSTMLRALDTAKPLARALGLRPTVRPDIHEVHGYHLNHVGVDGMGRPEMQFRFPNFDFWLIPENGLSGAESDTEAALRAQAVADSIREIASLDGAADQILVIVAHVDFLCLLTQALVLGSVQAAASSGGFFFDLNNTAVSDIVVASTPKAELAVQKPVTLLPLQPTLKTRLIYWNRSDHLSEDLRSGINWKSIGPDAGNAAAWARVGEGGSGVRPRFDEREVVCTFSPGWVTLASTAIVLGLWALRRAGFKV